MKNILVSACLLGVPCRYDGKSKPNKNVILLKSRYNLIPVCPEVFGGFLIPHLPSEIRNGRVINKNGKDVTDLFLNGAKKALDTAVKNKCDTAILKSKSPSCGTNEIYDGTFSGRLVKGLGITAELLMKNNIKVTDENNIDFL